MNTTQTLNERNGDATVQHDIISEGAESVTGVTRHVPKVDGRVPNPSTIFRWIMVGVNGIRLEHARVGRRIVTSEAALKRFFAALATRKLEERPTTFSPRNTGRIRSETQRAKEIAAASQRLKKAGI